jgi:hypothetical protein
MNKRCVTLAALSLLLFSACRRSCTTEKSTQDHTKLTVCRSSASIGDGKIKCDDLARWAKQGQQLGLDCLDERIRSALEATGQSQPFTKNQILFNPSPERLQANPKALAIYAIESANEASRLHWLRSVAMTVRLVAHDDISIIVIDRNLLRWMGTRIEHLIKGYREAGDKMMKAMGSKVLDSTPIANFVEVLTSREDGGFGKPLDFSAPPDALARYCKQDPTGEDMIVISYALDEILWTLRHEMHHFWHPTPEPTKKLCPTKQEYEQAAEPEIQADNFAIAQIKDSDLDTLLARWKDRVDSWTARYGGQTTLIRSARLTVLAYLVGHHETDIIVQKQSEPWIATGRYKNLAKLSTNSIEFATRSAAKLVAINALKASQECPSKATLEQQCKECPGNQDGCQRARDMAWKCADFLFLDNHNASEQQRLREDAFAHLRSLGFQVTEDPKNSNVHLQVYRIEREGLGTVLAGSLHGIPFPPEIGGDSEINTDSELERREAFRQGKIPRDIGGLMLMPDSGDPQPIIDILLAWETSNDRKSCESNDASACHRLGLALVLGRGFKVDLNALKAAKFAFQKACKLDPTRKKSCSQPEQLRQLLSSICADGTQLACEALK